LSGQWLLELFRLAVHTELTLNAVYTARDLLKTSNRQVDIEVCVVIRNAITGCHLQNRSHRRLLSREECPEHFWWMLDAIYSGHNPDLSARTRIATRWEHLGLKIHAITSRRFIIQQGWPGHH
jgi:hypothetical protein